MDFPNDIYTIIVPYLDFEELLRLRSINERFCQLVYDFGCPTVEIDTVGEGMVWIELIKNIKLISFNNLNPEDKIILGDNFIEYDVKITRNSQ